MRVLWLAAGLLLPLDKGGKLRTWHLLRHLARRHDVTWLSFASPDQPQADIQGMREVCREIATVPRRDAPKGSARFVMEAARHLGSPLPYAVGAYRSAAFEARVQQLLEQRRFDVVVADFLPPVVNLPASLPAPSVLFTHNVESEIWRRHAETAASGTKRWLLTTQWSRMLRFERDAVRRFDAVLAVSEADRSTLHRLYGPLPAPVHVVPTGVDTEYFRPAAGAERPGHLVFTGSMDWLPNEDAVLFFAREVLPRIRAAVPGVTVSIVGRTPTPAVQRLGRERGIDVTGRVEDVRPHIAAGAVYIVPLRVGGGTRLKIFEAMAMGKALVSTTVGAEGLPVRDGEHLRIADEPGEFAQAVVELLRSPAERARLGSAARRLVAAHYDWSAAAAVLEDALAAAASVYGDRKAATGH